MRSLRDGSRASRRTTRATPGSSCTIWPWTRPVEGPGSPGSSSALYAAQRCTRD
ncbi:hypothetical protein NKG05_26310 [Oerskovia sp. M15]